MGGIQPASEFDVEDVNVDRAGWLMRFDDDGAGDECRHSRRDRQVNVRIGAQMDADDSRLGLPALDDKPGLLHGRDNQVADEHHDQDQQGLGPESTVERHCGEGRDRGNQESDGEARKNISGRDFAPEKAPHNRDPHESSHGSVGETAGAPGCDTYCFR